MAFWNNAPEVFRQFRWVIVFGDTQKTITEGTTTLDSMAYALKKAAKPTMKIAEVQHKYLNHFYYYPGRVEWDPISISFAAITEPHAGKLLYKITENSGYVFPNTSGESNAEDRRTISKKKAREQVSNGSSIAIRQIDENGGILETWHLFNPFFTDIKFDSLEYASEEILNLDVTIRYDYATLNEKAALAYAAKDTV